MSFFGGALNIPEQVNRLANTWCGFTSVTFDPGADNDISFGEGAFSQLAQLTGAIELPTSRVSTHADGDDEDWSLYILPMLRITFIHHSKWHLRNWQLCILWLQESIDDIGLFKDHFNWSQRLPRLCLVWEGL